MNNIKRSQIDLLQKKIKDIYKQNTEELKKLSSQQKQMQSNTSRKCKKCGQPGLEYSVQTRSSDEAATVFFKCINPDCELFGVPKKIE